MKLPYDITQQIGPAIVDAGTQRAILAQVGVGMLVTPRRRVKTVALATVPESLTDFTITSIATSGLVATVTATAHQLMVGDVVTQRGATGSNAASFNRTVIVATVPDANTYTYALLKDIGGASSAGSVIGNVLIPAGRAEMLNTAASGTAHYGLSPVDSANKFAIASAAQVTLQCQAGRVFPLGAFYYDANADSEGVELIIYPSYAPG